VRNLQAERPQLYVERLENCIKKGLFAKRNNEATIRHRQMKRLCRICFTEIRLSEAQTHAQRFGKLGIGFKREFIMDKGGRPVIYVPFCPKRGGDLLEKSIKSVYENSSDHPEIHRSAKWIMAHVKRMSNGKSEESNQFENHYEEMEWRLVYDEKSKYFQKDETEENVYRMKFDIQDVVVIIFPDEETKLLAVQTLTQPDQPFAEYLPNMVTLGDCSSF